MKGRCVLRRLMNIASPHSIWCLAGAHGFSDCFTRMQGCDVTALDSLLQEGEFLSSRF